MCHTRRLILSVLISIIIALLGRDNGTVSAIETAQAGTARLNMLFVIDTSGSHYSTSDTHDWGVVRTVDRDIDPDTPDEQEATRRQTDPTNIRFDATTSLLRWLGQNDSALDADLSVNLVTFDNTASEWEPSWQPISAFTQPDFVFPPPPTTPTTRQTTDFTVMMESLGAVLSDRPPMATTVMFLITDSAECTSFEECGGTAQAIINRTQALNVPDRTIVHVLLTPFTANRDDFWAIHSDLRQAYVELAEGTGGTFTDFDNIDQMPSVLAQLVLAEIGRSKGRLTLPEGERLNAQTLEAIDWSALVPNLARMGRTGFDIPPYQSQAHFWVSLSRNSDVASYTPPRFFINNVSSDPYEDDTRWDLLGNAYQQQLARPPHLTLYPSSPNHNSDGFVFYTPARAEARIEPVNGAVVRQYEQARVVYQITDGTRVAFLQDSLPNLSATVRVGTTNFSLDHFTRNDDELALYSEPFFIESDQRYTVQINAQPQDDWTTTIPYDFLAPTGDDPTVTPKTMQFVAQIGADTAQTTLSIPQDTAIPITVYAQVDGARYPVPDGVTAQLVTQSLPNTDDACAVIQPQNAVFTPDTENDARVLKTSLEFEGAGVCQLSVTVTFGSVIKPVDDSFSVPASESLTRRVDVSPATRLAVGQLEATYTMDNYRDVMNNIFKPETLAWAFTSQNPPFPSDELAFTVQFIRENGEELLTAPVFASATQFPNRDHCPAAIRDQQVPFNLEILDSANHDKARELGICLATTDKAGVYLAQISQLAAGDYTLRATLNTNTMRLDNALYSYVDSLTATNNGIFVPSIRLTVADSSLAQFVRIGIFSAIGVLALILILLTRSLLITTYFSTRNPLRGKITILMQEGNGEKRPVWEQKLPRKHTRVYDDFDKTPELFRLALQQLRISTERDHHISRAEGAKITLKLSNAEENINLAKGQEEMIQAVDNYRYYIAKDYNPYTQGF